MTSLPAFLVTGAARTRVIGRVADHLAQRDIGHPLRVAVDGITAAGKSTLAAELVAALNARGHPAVHLSTDDFHHARARRYRQGRESPRGYYQDAYDFVTFGRDVLEPLGPGGNHRYRTASLDLETDEAVDPPVRQAAPDTIVIVDGSFLQVPVLASAWDEVVFVDTAVAVARARGSRRDAQAFGGITAAEDALDRRYHAAARIYLDEVAASAQATIVIGNDDIDRPILRRIGGDADAQVRLFSYGTLQLPAVQQATFGRLLEGRGGTVLGFHADWVTITDPQVVAVSGTDRHPVLRPGPPAAGVEGTVLTLTTAELAAADIYEVDDYRRESVALASGGRAWMYVARPDTG